MPIDGITWLEAENQGRAISDHWQRLPLLSFNNSSSDETGELHKQEAEYKGLTLTITPSGKPHAPPHCNIKGSLVRYAHQGARSAEDLTIEELEAVLYQLQEELGINPHTARLHGFEFGVNIHTPITCYKIIHTALIARGNKHFLTLSDPKRGDLNGRQIITQHHRFKIYNKGKWVGLQAKNLLRVEAVVRKMEHVKKVGITTLSDLTDRKKLTQLLPYLIEQWESIIMFGGNRNKPHRPMTPKQEKAFMTMLYPSTWVEYTFHQREKAKAKFYHYKVKYFDDHTQEEIKKLIFQKWDELTAQKRGYFNQDLDSNRADPTAQKRRLFNRPLKPIDQNQKGDILTSKISGYNIPLNGSENIPKKAKSKKQKTMKNQDKKGGFEKRKKANQ